MPELIKRILTLSKIDLADLTMAEFGNRSSCKTCLTHRDDRRIDRDHSLSNAFTASSAVLCALAGFAPVTILPSVKAKESQGPGGATSAVT